MSELRSVAALYDIHGNAVALAAVLAELELQPPDAVVVGGDVSAGPQPLECLALLRALPVPVHFIRGNADRVVVMAYDGSAPDHVSAHPLFEADTWTAARLPRAERDFLAALPRPHPPDRCGPGRGALLPRHRAQRRGTRHRVHAGGAASARARSGGRAAGRGGPHPPPVRSQRRRLPAGQRRQRRPPVRARARRVLAAARARHRAPAHSIRRRRRDRAVPRARLPGRGGRGRLARRRRGRAPLRGLAAKPVAQESLIAPAEVR